MDQFEQTIQKVQQQLVENENYIIIKMYGKECRLFKSVSNGRLPEETFDEYKLRQKINKKTIKLHKKGK